MAKFTNLSSEVSEKNLKQETEKLEFNIGDRVGWYSPYSKSSYLEGEIICYVPGIYSSRDVFDDLPYVGNMNGTPPTKLVDDIVSDLVYVNKKNLSYDASPGGKYIVAVQQNATGPGGTPKYVLYTPKIEWLSLIESNVDPENSISSEYKNEVVVGYIPENILGIDAPAYDILIRPRNE